MFRALRPPVPGGFTPIQWECVMKLAASLTCLSATLLFSAVALFTVTAAPGGSIYPVQIGTKWVFQAGGIELVEQVAGYDMIGQERCVRIETMLNGKVVAHEHLALRQDGVYRVAIAGEPVSPPLCFLKHPAAQGTQWDVSSKVKGQEIAGRFTLGAAQVDVPAGQFQAISVQGSNFQSEAGPLEFTYYFVPGIGKVKQVIKVNGRGAELSLKEFRPAS